MSNDRDINDILDSLNQLLREGESHNDDHVESDEQAREIEAELHELEEGLPEASGAEPEEIEQVEDGIEPSNEASDDMTAEHSDDHSGDSSEEDESIEASIAVQRVVLTEAMLVDNPQGNLLSKGNGNERAESVAEPEPLENERVEAVQEESSEQRLEQLVERVSDAVISQLQQELPSLIKTALYQHLSEFKDDELSDTEQPENHSEE